MIDKYNIPLENKLTKEIIYYLNLDSGYWDKAEYNSRGNEIEYVYIMYTKVYI